MTRSEVNPREWQATGYYPTMTDDSRMERQKIHLDHHIECSKKITTLLVNWLYNITIGGLIVAAGSAFIGATCLIISYIGTFL